MKVVDTILKLVFDTYNNVYSASNICIEEILRLARLNPIIKFTWIPVMLAAFLVDIPLSSQCGRELFFLHDHSERPTASGA